MSERRPYKIQVVIPSDEIDQFEQLRQDLWLTKAIDVFRKGLDALHFLVEEAKKVAEVSGHRPDGTFGTHMIRVVERIRRKAVQQEE